MAENYERGVSFENRIAEELSRNRIEYKRQYRLKGFGKKWLIDFYLYNMKEHKTLLESKNVGRNLIHSITSECVKFLDIRNASSEYSFMIVFPSLSHGINSLSKFCSAYDIRLATVDTFIEALKKNIKEQNMQFSLSDIQKQERSRRTAILNLLKLKDGLNLSEISQKVKIEPSLCYGSLRRLERATLVIGVRKKHQDKKYYVKTASLA